MIPSARLLSLPFLLSMATVLGASESDRLVITEGFVHLGNAKKPDWKSWTTVDPAHATKTEFRFALRSAPASPRVLEIAGGGTSGEWRILLNDAFIADLRKSDPGFTQFVEVPAKRLRAGTNVLAVETKSAGDDIWVGKASLHSRPLRELLGLVPLRVKVRDATSKEALPARLTVTTATESPSGKKAKQELVEFAVRPERGLAVRKGICYAGTGTATLELAPGKYTIHATRGLEYDAATKVVEIRAGEGEREETLEIRREVPTDGWLAADTHMHTRTFSGHGDIDLEERIACVAGEGLEVAIATDHNHATDYARARKEAGDWARFATIVGDEVTTSVGHFNVFPLDPARKPPKHSGKTWERVLDAVRSTEGVRVVIWNHPERKSGKRTFAEELGLDPFSGEVHLGPSDLWIDAFEIVNASTPCPDRRTALRDWFALLNRGYRIHAVAGSDSHAVAQVVGQGRTYVANDAIDPVAVSVSDVCDAFLAGRLLVSYGLFALVRVDGRHGVGDLAVGLERTMKVSIRISGPSWTAADEVALFLDGVEVRREAVEPSANVAKYESTWELPVPSHDAHLVVAAWGPSPSVPWWPQGSTKYVLAATNPIWLDADGDGAFTCARVLAERLLSKHANDAAALSAALASADAAVAVQAAALLRERATRELQAAYEKALEAATLGLEAPLSLADPVAAVVRDYLRSAPPIDVRTRRERSEAQAEAEAEAKKTPDRVEEETKPIPAEEGDPPEDEAGP